MKKIRFMNSKKKKKKKCYICKIKFCTNENNENEFKLYKKSQRLLALHWKV